MSDPNHPPGDFLGGGIPPGAAACIAARGYLPLYVGEDLDPAQMEAVRAHVAACESCSAEVRAAGAARAAIQTLARRRDEALDVWPAVRSELAADGRFERGRHAISGGFVAERRRWAVRGGLAALAAAAAVAIGFELLSGGVPRSIEPRAPAPAPIASAELSAPVIPAGAPNSNAGGLRRAGPEDERMRNRALPFGERERIGAPDGVWSLAGDRQVK